MKKLVIASMLAATFSFVAAVDARPHANHGMDRVHPIKKMVHSLRGLSLTEAQLLQVKALVSEFRENNERPERGEKPSMEEILAMDEAAFYTMIEEKIETKAERKLAMAELRHSVYSVLTEEQQAQLAEREANREERRQNREGRRGNNNGQRGEMAQRGGRHGEMLRGLDITDEQKEQIASLNASFRQSAKAHKSLIRTFRSEEKALVRSDAFSAEAWQALASSYQSQWVDMAVAKAMHKQALLNVLTTEQQAELEARRQEARLFRSTFRQS
ncbi:Spy/CpxP family protein refolding chaperone [Alteromonas sp. KUL49]|uniref:Spy/CpxP family protein refolding chaperone n=1 Tax=Alteromonas sp. KUL49 TaxID=2480798 RepID=UPI00102F15FB|nr:Spy/CpxP family protein refolding chaperone [Alteromonas sp. KUL49]TAP42542.1 hypothetical protein EYS00_02700 [Alteromonas sp. KUL49]GEA10174.1 hypothetical protein KUL49_05490 [Alteromonas sp. KUL49]